MKFFVVNNKFPMHEVTRYFYIEANNIEDANTEAFNRLSHNCFKVYVADKDCIVTPNYTNIYLCTLNNGESCCDFSDYTITVTAKDEAEARINAMKKFNGNLWGPDFGDYNIKKGGTLSVQLEYENVILSKKI